jgi:hypothetical protein
MVNTDAWLTIRSYPGLYSANRLTSRSDVSLIFLVKRLGLEPELKLFISIQVINQIEQVKENEATLTVTEGNVAIIQCKLPASNPSAVPVFVLNNTILIDNDIRKPFSRKVWVTRNN